MPIAGHFENAVERLKRGEIILAKQYLRRHDLPALLTELTLIEIRKVAGAKADAVAVRGFEALHEVLTAEEIFRVNVSLSEAVKPHLYRFAPASSGRSSAAAGRSSSTRCAWCGSSFPTTTGPGTRSCMPAWAPVATVLTASPAPPP
jgi:hypothetical protein